jgi:hypothetical protein
MLPVFRSCKIGILNKINMHIFFPKIVDWTNREGTLGISYRSRYCIQRAAKVADRGCPLDGEMAGYNTEIFIVDHSDWYT